MSALIEINEKSSIPVWLQIKNRLMYLIESGYYKVGEQLPTVRGLAVEVEVNYNTISKVYMSLEQEGYIETRQRHGAFVCDVSKKAQVSRDKAAEMVTRDYVKSCLDLGLAPEDITEVFTRVLADMGTDEGK